MFTTKIPNIRRKRMYGPSAAFYISRFESADIAVCEVCKKE
jgi:hypothetical protein